jgi:hypothetical protein
MCHGRQTSFAVTPTLLFGFRNLRIRQAIEFTPHPYEQTCGGQARQDDPGRTDGGRDRWRATALSAWPDQGCAACRYWKAWVKHVPLFR